MHTELKLTMKSRNTISPDRGPSHHHLIPFTGHWKVEGKNGSKDSTGNEESVSGEEIYEWLEGDYFLLNRFERTTATSIFKGMGWISFDKATGAYLSYSISNNGFLRIYEVEISDARLRFIGEQERGLLILNNEQNTLSLFWEQSTDGQNWQMLCDLMGRRMT